MSLVVQASALVLLMALAVSYRALPYFAVLLLAMYHCYSQPVGITRKVLSALCVVVTWFYIIHFMWNYSGPDNSFDAAYADVIWGGRAGNWGHTQTLLSWAVVATVWSADASIFCTIFGVFGAMSGSYLLFRSPEKPSSTVPGSYAVASVLAFLSIVVLPFTTTVHQLSWALWVLHVALVAPRLVPIGPQVDRCGLYLILAVLSLAVHVSAGASPWPDTDCRISITIDAFVCACLTVAFALERLESTAAALFCAALVPVASPGCVLGALCALDLGLGPRLVGALQERAAQRARAQSAASDADGKWRSGTWMNMGYWKDQTSEHGRIQHYDTACMQLARQVALTGELAEGCSVLSVACGYGDELNYFQAAFRLKEVAGLDSNPRAAELFKPAAEGARLLRGDAADMIRGRQLFRHGDFDRIVAVDSIYHCDKAQFFADCAQLLPSGGVVAVSDVVLQPGAPAWLRLLLRLMGIRPANHWTKAEYGDRLCALGFEVLTCQSLEPFVLGPWLPDSMRRHLDYVVVGARLRSAAKRPAAAVIGSGLSGLVAAHLLTATHDVSIFEARPVPGFAGMEAKLPSGGVIDIPLRMIEPHYWKTLVGFCRQLGVPLKDTNFTVSITGEDSAFLKTDASLASSVLLNLRHYLRVLASAARLCFTSTRGDETLLQFVSRVGLADTDFYRIYVRRHLSWVLSCTYEMVDTYPAQLVLGFFRAIQSNYVRQKGPTMRIDPSVRALETVLLRGKSIITGHPVKPFAEATSSKAERVIDGKTYDAVVIATEASAVPRLLPLEWASMFSEFRYHPSVVFVHRDPSLMPASREDWRALNISDDVKGEACQLTVWVNAFYESDDLGGDIFETVNPRQLPRPESVVREVHLQRVVHGLDSARLQAQIEKLQGRDGFYFCGAYAVPGMGLLEQACLAAQKAAEAVQRDLIPKDR